MLVTGEADAQMTRELRVKSALYALGFPGAYGWSASGTMFGTHSETRADSYRAKLLDSFDPTTGLKIGSISVTTAEEYQEVVRKAKEAFLAWRMVPAPKRGELIRLLGDEFRKHKQPLAELISIEMGKILPESLGEVQEAIDICEYAVGLSRQPFGKVELPQGG